MLDILSGCGAALKGIVVTEGLFACLAATLFKARVLNPVADEQLLHGMSPKNGLNLS